MSDNPQGNQESVEKEEVNATSELATGSGGTEETANQLSEEEKLRAQLAESNDKFIRLFAEFDNYKRRANKERLDLIKTAGSEMIMAMLPVLDDFERAMKFSQNAEGKSGVELIYQKLRSTLEAKGLKRMESIGIEFDADLHEAITSIPAPEENLKGKVVDEAECGYMLNDKVIRFAKVIVGS
ncbi:MAG: nucleotide exchange factor GrpE [Bacteroidota bacterium]|jgi:molecular chaperone GrpE